MQDFLRSHLNWLQKRISELPESTVFAPQAIIPLRGEPVVIVHDSALRGPARLGEKTIVMGGDVRHLPRRLTEFLKKEARCDFEVACARYAQQLNVQIRRLQLRDTITRWGSCNRSGTLCFSWRLIFAPPFVLDYLAAHEVAHLRHMDHSKKFWALVEDICPRTQEARAWLKTNGNALLAIG